MQKNPETSNKDINLFLNSSLLELLNSLKTDLPKKKIEKVLSAFQFQNDYINELFGKMRKIGLFINDVENNKVFPNDLWYKLGYTEDDMLNVGFLELVHPDDLQKVKDQSILPASQGEDVNKVIFRFRSKEGSWHWLLSSTVSITTNEKGYVRQYIGFDSDITQEMEVKELLEKALVQAHEAREEAEASVIEANTLREVSSIITSSLDLGETLKAILDQAKKVIPYDTASVQILKDNHLTIIGGGGWKEPDKVLGLKFPIPGDNPNTIVIETKEPVVIKDISKNKLSFKINSAEYLGESWIGIPLLMRNEAIGMMTFDSKEKKYFTDNHIKLGKSFASHVAVALENARIYEEVKELAAIDPLTGAHNRRSFYEYALQQENLYKRYGTEFSIIMLDIDYFKNVNDDFGHQVGDTILKNLVSIIKSGLRDSDFLCRYGGEEFVILLPQSDESDAYEIAERIRKSVKSSLKINGSSSRITISNGCAELKSSELGNVDSLIKIADKAMYYAKNNGRDQSQRFSTMVE
ncbi:MAG: diguanylate cyclase [Spirochaetales bacterium]|nr:diguanylate cyclase [Spirochaetales bacterium]